jgi:hypothetical protein
MSLIYYIREPLRQKSYPVSGPITLAECFITRDDETGGMKNKVGRIYLFEEQIFFTPSRNKVPMSMEELRQITEKMDTLLKLYFRSQFNAS